MINVEKFYLFRKKKIKILAKHSRVSFLTFLNWLIEIDIEFALIVSYVLFIYMKNGEKKYREEKMKEKNSAKSLYMAGAIK